MEEYGIITHHFFVDFNAAYDSIDRTQIFIDMEKFHIPENLETGGDRFEKH